MPKGPAVPLMGVELRRDGNHAVVLVEFEDGRSVEVIREYYDGHFCHHVTEHGLAKAKE